jgi:NADPH-dependent glutamate synthase beta subunit-like oxidoreductase
MTVDIKALAEQVRAEGTPDINTGVNRDKNIMGTYTQDEYDIVLAAVARSRTNRAAFLREASLAAAIKVLSPDE